MKLYNTLTRKAMEFIPNEPGKVKLYTCGPTVYNYAHIGNLRTYIMEDVLEKTLGYVGYNVERCMNITDVGHLSSDSDTGDDKMVRSAKEMHKSVLDIAKMYTEAFFNDCDKLNIKKPEIVSNATDNIDGYIKNIELLMDKGYAYEANGNVYFDTSKLDNYYTLTNNQEDDLIVGARDNVEEDSSKRNKTDFVLWFTKSKFDTQDLKWDSPFGFGYPGWHIECSCISIKYLGEKLDIHCGGVDNKFPHHTNEIAQSEAILGHKWCNYWFHSEFLNDNTGKMSKSKGDFLVLSLLEGKGYNPLAYRYYCLGSHYRKQLAFSYEGLDQASNAYNKLLSKVKSLNVKDMELEKTGFDEYKDRFKDALEDDLNTASALTVLYDVLKSDLNDKTKYELVKDFDKVLSLSLTEEKKVQLNDELKEYIEKKLEERKLAKQNKDFALSDKIRDELLEKGIIIKDTREGTIYETI